MILSEQIASLQEQLTAAQGQAQENYRLLGIATAAREASDLAVTTLTAERDEARTNLAAMTTERDTAAAALLTEQASRETAISAEVIKRCAGAGIDPITRDPSASAPGEPKAAGGLTGLAKARALLAAKQAVTAPGRVTEAAV